MCAEELSSRLSAKRYGVRAGRGHINPTARKAGGGRQHATSEGDLHFVADQLDA